MLGKLLKYDFRSMWKQFAFVWPAALTVALVNRFTLPMLNGNFGSDLAAGLAMMVYVSVLIAMFVLATLFVIQRFYKGLLGDEGYLMHTLPVRPWQLITSKLICAVALTIISLAVAFLSILLLSPITPLDLLEALRVAGAALAKLIQEYHVNVPLLFVELLLLCLMGLLTSFLHLYLAMAIGHLFNKNRIAMSIIAYVGINIAVSVLTSSLGYGFFFWFGQFIAQLLSGLGGWAAWHIMMWGAVASFAALTLVFFLATEHILRKHLNLE